jgi:hypothetical protein
VTVSHRTGGRTVIKQTVGSPSGPHAREKTVFSCRAHLAFERIDDMTVSEAMASLCIS